MCIRDSLEGGDLLHALGDVDVGQVVQHHEGQQAGRDDEHHHDGVDFLHHIAEAVLEVGHHAHTGYAVLAQQFCTEGAAPLGAVVGRVGNEGGLSLIHIWLGWLVVGSLSAAASFS